MASGLSLFLPILLLFAIIYATDVDENLCKTRVVDVLYCFDKMGLGMECGGEGGAATKCFKQCLDIARIFGDIYSPMKSFEEAICEAKLDKEVRKNRKCFELIFKYCNDVYNYNWSEPGNCRDGRKHFEMCEKDVKPWIIMLPNYQDCATHLDKVHNVYRARCPREISNRYLTDSSKIHVIQNTWILIVALIILMSTQITF